MAVYECAIYRVDIEPNQAKEVAEMRKPCGQIGDSDMAVFLWAVIDTDEDPGALVGTVLDDQRLIDAGIDLEKLADPDYNPLVNRAPDGTLIEAGRGPANARRKKLGLMMQKEKARK